MHAVPLAEKLRPVALGDVIGQEHLLGRGKILPQLLASKQLTSLILWGPPGTGKTTLARIIAAQSDAHFIELSGVTSSKADITKVIEDAKVFHRLGQKTVLFVDEIHRFNKSQQDTFLPHVENGTIILIGATTENPSFEVIRPLLSRSRVLTLEPLSEKALINIIERAAEKEGLSKKQLPSKSIALLAKLAHGDARIALGNLELAMQLTNKTITTDIVSSAAQQSVPGYDKNGDMHYDIVSAFIKSMRGSDVHATLYYLARLLQAGEDPKFIARRMVIFASEDIGIAASPALNLAVSTFQAVERIGLPECRYAMYHCAIALAKAEKSRAVSDAMSTAETLAKQYPNSPVPLHLRNAPTKLMQTLGHNKGYQWQAGFRHPDGFLPDDVSSAASN